MTRLEECRTATKGWVDDAAASDPGLIKQAW